MYHALTRVCTGVANFARRIVDLLNAINSLLPQPANRQVVLVLNEAKEANLHMLNTISYAFYTRGNNLP